MRGWLFIIIIITIFLDHIFIQVSLSILSILLIYQVKIEKKTFFCFSFDPCKYIYIYENRRGKSKFGQFVVVLLQQKQQKIHLHVCFISLIPRYSVFLVLFMVILRWEVISYIAKRRRRRSTKPNQYTNFLRSMKFYTICFLKQK